MQLWSNSYHSVITNYDQREHIYRAHRLPPQCQRCYLRFESMDDLREHSRSRDACPLRPPPANAPVGINDHQETQLKRRALFSGLTEVEKWTKMYQILFPDEVETIIPNPCEYVQEYFLHWLWEANSNKTMRIPLVTQLWRRAYDKACLLSAKFLE